MKISRTATPTLRCCTCGEKHFYLNANGECIGCAHAPSLLDEMELEAAWQALQHVPSYVEAQARAFAEEV